MALIEIQVIKYVSPRKADNFFFKWGLGGKGVGVFMTKVGKGKFHIKNDTVAFLYGILPHIRQNTLVKAIF